MPLPSNVPVRASLILACLGCIAATTGCYERTVYAQGMGAKGMSVQKPYRSETAADRWFDESVMGKKPVKRRPGGTVSTVAPAPSGAAGRVWTTGEQPK